VRGKSTLPPSDKNCRWVRYGVFGSEVREEVYTVCGMMRDRFISEICVLTSMTEPEFSKKVAVSRWVSK
jgi:hypothetical protein